MTFCILATFVSGCEDRNGVVAGSRATAPDKDQRPAIRSKGDLERLLLPGMGTNEIVLALGAPRWIESLSKGEQVWDHNLPPFPENSDAQGNFTTYVVGVTIGITNGQLAYWGCVSQGVPSGRIVRSENVPSNGEGQADVVELKFFVVSKNPIADGRFIDTERLPRLGFIAPNPTLVINKVKEVTLEERMRSDSKKQNSTNWSFGVFLTQEDSVRLKTMTTTNVDERLLIMIGDEPVCAPTLMMPLETGSFEMEIHDKSLMELLQKGFAKMERQNQ